MENLQQINIGLSQDMLARIKELAEAEERSIAGQIRLILKLYFEENK